MGPNPREPSSDPPLALEHFLPFRLSVLSGRMTRAVARVYARRFHLSAPEWRTLAVLGRFGAMSANGVAERSAMDKVRVSRAVTRLMARGHITRRADPEDRRRVILDLTSGGLDTVRQIVPLVLATETRLLAVLSAEEHGMLDGLLTKLETRTAELARGAADDDSG